MNRVALALSVALLTASQAFAADKPPATTAPASQPALSPAAAARAAELKAKADSLVFAFTYVGASDKPFYNVTLSTPDFMLDEPKDFDLIERITPEQAGRIVDALAAAGRLEPPAPAAPAAPADPNRPANGYTLKISGEKVAYTVNLGFDLKTLKTLDTVAAAVDGPAAKAMKRLLARLSGFRKQWEGA